MTTRCSAAVFTMLMTLVCGNRVGAIWGYGRIQSTGKRPPRPEAALIQWVLDNGGVVNVESKVVRPGLRGVVALRDFAPGEIVLRIPESVSFLTGSSHSMEQARVLLAELNNNNTAYRPYFDALPGADDIISSESLDDAHISLLQDPQLEEAVQIRRSYPAEFATPGGSISVDGVKVGFQEFQWAAAAVSTRTYSWPNTTNRSVVEFFLVPVLDMVNHAEGAPTTVLRAEGSIWLNATRPIQKGEEVTYEYGPMRNDKAALCYGFILPEDPPRLCSRDYPGSDQADVCVNAPSAAAEHDSDIQAGGRRAMQSELFRLKSIWFKFPTTASEDQKILDSGPDLDPKARHLINFRMKRKEALEAAIKKLELELGEL